MYSEKILNKLIGKNIAILGFGREGKSTYSFIRKHLKDTSNYVKINKHRNDLLKDLEKDEKTYNIFNPSEKITEKRE